MDSQGNKAGKGPLVAEEISNTLGTSQDQTLFQPVAMGFCTEHSANSRSIGAQEECSPTLRAGVTPAVAVGPDAAKLHEISSVLAFDGYNQQVTGDKTMTLRAGMSNCSSDTIPVIVTFEPGIAAREGGHIYESVSGTLRAKMGDNQMAVAYSVENHPADSRVNIDDSGKCQTLTSRMGTGGGNVPMVMCVDMGAGKSTCGIHKNKAPTLATTHYGEPVICMASQQGNAEIMEDKAPTITAMAGMSGNNQPVVCLEGNGSRPSHRGDGYKVADEMFTLNTTEVHSVCYGICSYDSNAMRSANPSSGIYEAATSRTLDLNGGNPACNQGGMVVIEPKYQGMILDDITPKHSTGDIAFTTRGTDYKRDGGLCVVMSYQKHTGPLMASGYEKNGTQEAMSDMYVVEPMYWDGSQIAGTLTANNAGGNQRMPDKNHFQCVLQPVASFYPQMKAESQCYREDGVANTLVNGTNPGFQNGVVVPK